MSYFKVIKNQSKVVNNVRVYRIQATETFETPFGTVKKGDLGGWICSNSTLKNNSWFFGDAVVINSWLTNRSCIKGDHVYSQLGLDCTTINGTCDYITGYGRTTFFYMNVEGSSIINANPRAIIWGTHKTSKEIIVCVGCQQHNIQNWRKNFKLISRSNGFDTIYIEPYLKHLDTIEQSLKSSNENILNMISENVNSMKSSVTESLKTETIFLIQSLVVSKVSENSGPKRDPVTGRFAKKTP